MGRSRPGKPSREPVAGASLGSRKPGAKQDGAQPSRQAEPNGSRSEHRSVSRRRIVRPRKIGPRKIGPGPCSCSIGPWQSTNPATTGCPLAARDCRPPQPRESLRTRGERRSHSNGRRVVAASVLPRRPRRWRRRKRLAGTSAPHPGHCFAGAESRNDHQFSRGKSGLAPVPAGSLFLQYRPLAEYQPGYDGLPVGGKGLPPSTAARIPQNPGRTAQPFEWATRRSRVGTAEATAPLAPSKAARRDVGAPPWSLLRGSRIEKRSPVFASDLPSRISKKGRPPFAGRPSYIVLSTMERSENRLPSYWAVDVEPFTRKNLVVAPPVGAFSVISSFAAELVSVARESVSSVQEPPRAVWIWSE